MPEFMKAGDPIWIVPYDPTWPQQFQQLAQPLRAALGSVALRIDHIGSTSIPQLAAKPVIDIQISVADFEPLDAYRLPLEHLGYIFRADNPERTSDTFERAPDKDACISMYAAQGALANNFHCSSVPICEPIHKQLLRMPD